MAGAAELALDEIQWYAPDWIQHFGGIHENTVLFYFSKSPFFDPTSNNASLETQAMYNPDMMHFLGTRETFEAQLRTLQGLEYLVHLSPKDFGNEAQIGQGVWVIRKQNRRKRAGFNDEITILSTYFVVGEHIYMAPSVGNILQNRMISTTLALSKLMKTATTLPYYSPALGHRYFQPMLKARETLSVQSAQPSREGTPMPDASQAGIADVASGAAGPNPTSSTANFADTQTLFESFGQFLRYGKEYMDENPLVGEPGAFVFTSSKTHLQAQQELAAKKAAQQAVPKLQIEVKASPTPEPRPPTAQAKPDQPTSAKRSKNSDKSSSLGKPKRRKSKAPKSPGSPASPTSAISIG